MPHFLTQHIFHRHIHYNEMNELYISLSLRALSVGVGGLFVPLFLYDFGYSLVAIALFYIYAMGLRLPMELAGGFLIARIGAKHTITLSFASLFAFYMSLYFMSYFSWLWLLAGFFLAVEMSFFWTSYHLQVSKFRAKGRASRQVGLIIILNRVFMAMGPLIGGLIAAAYGVEFTMLAAAILLLAAGYPLFKTPDFRSKYKMDLKQLKFLLLRKDGVAHAAWQLSGVIASYLWPLWLLLVLADYQQVGMVVALSILAGVGLTAWVGQLGDRGMNQKLLKVGSRIKVISHGTRVVSGTFGLALVANILNDLGDNFAVGPFTEKFYEAADKGSRFMYVLQVHIVAAFAKFMSWVLLFVIALALSEIASLQTMFVLAAVFTPLMLWVSSRPQV